jgi:tRNA(Ile)-lysidine synthase
MTRAAGPFAAARPGSGSVAVSAAEAARFAAALERLWPEGGRLGLAVSGGPDSLAMLLLAQAAIPGRFEVATVDHGLRAESAAEAGFVQGTCSAFGVPHATLRVEVTAGNLQDEARSARYAALASWAAERELDAIATAHHADDQAETLLMRLNRGSGLSGLAGVRARGVVPGRKLALIRPLLDWRRDELSAIVERAGVAPVEDPSNADPRFDRARIRAALAGADWLDPAAMAQSAAHLADAEETLAWAFELEWDLWVEVDEGAVRYTPHAPRALVLRVVERIIAGFGGEPRGGAVARLVDALEAGRPGTLGGVVARIEDDSWLFRPESGRRA